MFNIQLVNNSSYPISYQVSPDQKQVVLNNAPDSRTPAGFLISDLPTFLQQMAGLYLGKPYYPQVRINNQMYFLQATNRPNVYDLVQTNMDLSKLFGFVLVKPDLNWQTPYDLSNILFYNFSTGSATKFSFNGTPSRNGALVYSPLLCPNDCQMCGDVCPDLFNCMAGQCVNNVTQGPTFGLRGKGSNGQDYVYTYKIISMNGGQALVMAATLPKYISAQIETNDIVRERYFYTDYDGENQFVVGKSYPIYTIINGQKRYLSTPVGPPSSGHPSATPNPTSSPTLYTLTQNPVSDTAKFSPKTSTNWGQFNLTPDQFPNLAYTEPTSLALWQTSALIGQPAVSGPSPLLPTGLNTSSIPLFLQENTPVFATLGSPELPPTAPNILLPQGATCSLDTDCDGWGSGVGQSACCGGRCQKLLQDWAGNGVCPDLCRGCPTCDVGTCGATPVTQPFLLGAVAGANAVTPLWKQWWFWVVIAVIVILIIIIFVVALWPRPASKKIAVAVPTPVASTALPPALPTVIPPLR